MSWIAHWVLVIWIGKKIYNLGQEDYDKMSAMFGVVENIDSEIALKPQNFIFGHKCYIGNRYLVVEKKFHPEKNQDTSFLGMKNPAHRFLKITDGMVDVNDIPTNYQFTGETIISVEEVKAWIREGGAASGTDE